MIIVVNEAQDKIDKLNFSRLGVTARGDNMGRQAPNPSVMALPGPPQIRGSTCWRVVSLGSVEQVIFNGGDPTLGCIFWLESLGEWIPGLQNQEKLLSNR